MIIAFILFGGEITLFFQRNRLCDAGRENPHLADGNALFAVHPDRVFVRIHCRFEINFVDSLVDPSPYRLVDNLVDVAGLQLTE